MKFALTLLILVIINQAKTEESCTTPDQQAGKCIDLYGCPVITEMMSTKIWEKVRFVKKSRCGGSTFSVCCPDSEKELRDCGASSVPDPGCCGQDGTVANKIIEYSQKTYIDEYTWLALIEYIKDEQSQVLCGGTLISSKHVLTAAHCVAGDMAKLGKPTNVQLGEYDITKNRDCGEIAIAPQSSGLDCNDDLLVIPIETIIVHPEYNPENSLRKHDIAILNMAKMAPYTDFIHPICLPSSDLATSIIPYDGSNYIQAKVSGWGTGVPRTSNVTEKQHADVHILNKEDCQPLYNNITLSEEQICAGGSSNQPSCKGDDGGPLMYRDHLRFHVIGIASIGVSSCKTNEPIVYINVYHYLPWIHANIKKHTQKMLNL